MSLEVDDSLGESQMNRTVDSSSESNCFSKCRNVLACKSATFFADSDNGPKCLLKDTNRFGVRNRIKHIANGKYFEKTESCSKLSRERRRVIGTVKKAFDCKDVLKRGWKKDGVYLIQHPGEDVYRPIRCRMSILGGGWTVIQRRVDGSLSFKVDWRRYKHGFGEVSREFWYGNDNIHNLTKNGDNEVIFELQSASGVFYHPYYQQFKVDSEATKYKLTVGPYEHKYGIRLPAYPYYTTMATGYDFLYHNQGKFSTSDQDNDGVSNKHCANRFGGVGWWYRNCGAVILNAPEFGAIRHLQALKWGQITNEGDNTESLKSTEMMVRRKH